jgi:hypothetical protein
MQRLKDLRTAILNLETADAVLAEIAMLECDIAVAEARAEKRIAAAKAALEEAVAEPRRASDSLKTALGQFIENNRDLFKKPRKRKTAMGSYGLQTVTELIVDNEDALVTELLERGYDDCLKTVRKPVKTALVDRINGGETFPGCAVFTGDTAVCKVEKSVVDAAREGEVH